MALKSHYQITIPTTNLVIETEKDLKNYVNGTLFMKDGTLYMLMRFPRGAVIPEDPLKSKVEDYFLRMEPNGSTLQNLFKAKIVLPLELAPFGTKVTIEQK